MALKLRFEKPFVKDNTERITKAESEITQNAQEIASRVTLQTYNALEDRVNNAESTITQNANQIASKVSQTDYNGNTIASLINQTPSTVKIQASHIQLEGIVTANTNFKVLADGSIEAKNAVLSGSITATRMVATSNSSFYGEIGVTGGIIGLGLFDTRYGTEAYCEILEYENGNSFGIRGKNNKVRFLATPNGTYLNDHTGANRIYVDGTYSLMYSPSKNVYIDVANNGVSIVKNGSVIASWGY